MGGEGALDGKRLRPLLLVNPPSPRGTRANREGFGGLGVVTPGRRGFVYPAHLLAEAAAVLAEHAVRFRVADLVLSPLFGSRRLFHRLPELAGGYDLLVRSSAATFANDVAWVVRSRVPVGRAFFAGVGLRAFEPAQGGAPFAVTILEVGDGFAAAAGIAGFDEPPSPESAPFARWDLLPLGRARRLPLWHSRGCGFSCGYCPYVLATGRRIVPRPAVRTVAEFAQQVRLRRPKRVVFRDPLFFHPGSGSDEVVAGIAALPREARAPFEIETRPEVLDDARIESLRAAGAVEIKLGVESLEASALIANRRLPAGTSAEEYRGQVERVLGAAERAGIAVRCFLLGGLPGATPAGDRASAEALSRHPLVVRKDYRPPVPEAGATIGGHP